ncbi:hypothetical protein [uncultured Parvibaculum sp.]|uniref:hypothetical protein n=1 Tax=uncultured Parvibaculum sp. TaxID=291828 RepID=UPI0030D75C3A
MATTCWFESGQGHQFSADHSLHEHKVEPAAEFGADLGHRDLAKAEVFMAAD